MKRFNELQENSEQQLKELRSKINDQKELFTKETKKKNFFFNKQTKILELKKSMTLIKNTFESLGKDTER